jgi:signal transduction histidine kinase
LAIAHRAVMAHRGRLTAENAGPGLRVRMELPLDSN